jgi:2-polyprenyl-6-methoxyphenol hydroxylase-like FAD-dependent oxidoreductase
MDTVAIIGTGFSGLTLALRLQQLGVPTTLYAESPPDVMRHARLTNTVGRFPRTRARERQLGVDHWPAPEESMAELHFRSGPPLGLGYDGRFADPMQATDFRVLLPRLLEDLADRGGDVVIAPGLDAEAVAHIAEGHELTVAAVGRGSIASMFPVDAARSPYREPPRITFAGLFDGLALPEPRAVSFNLSPAGGAVFQMAMRTPHGPGTSLLVSAIPGGPLAALDGLSVTDPEFRPTLLGLLRDHAPAVAERVDGRRFALTAPHDWVQAAITPTVRRAWHRLPSGRLVVAIGDAWIANDPITGQGANLGSDCAFVAAEHIALGGPFDSGFGRRLEDAMWEVAGPVTEFTNAFLQPPPPHVLDLMAAAAAHRAVADRYVSLFDDPSRMWRMMASPETVRAFVEDARRSGPDVRAA